ncbi:CRISPR-associated protein Csx3 [Sphaerospermopsis aphanizomenoides BCCUSP55]|uniref:CRISPR-associated ring nuclease Crn3/Csx3 n=1 Tax=Sphaerospermopsis aphanizomenoides TaxID=459663 RepID=UPI00190584C0|nr:CRISPR-associated ring nuclease Crn3/Csx3 [Sphaerospermopsis aphanizomenoides]MBK1986917.1 CRISPR-associated protein Csx3 [Sphaerospermopsis aphanizomenoides BCCUSP55]
MTEPALRLLLSETLMVEALQYQMLLIELTKSDRIIEPQDLIDLELPAGIDTTGGVVISGRAPIWLYGYLIHELHPTAWVACYDPRMGAVVVATHTRLVHIGQVIKIIPPNGRTQEGNSTPEEWSNYFQNLQELRAKNTSISPLPQQEKLCPALMVVGPPDSGKSVFSHALFQALLSENPDIYLQRAHWDGEGNYVLEMGTEATDEEIEAFKARNRGSLTERFFPYQAQAILQLRRQKSLVIVDVGGMVQPEKLPLLEVCTHYLIISSRLEAVDGWHDFCGSYANLIPVAVIFSTLTEVEIVHTCEPYVEITCGAWVRGKARAVPEILLERVRKIVNG